MLKIEYAEFSEEDIENDGECLSPGELCACDARNSSIWW